MQELPPDAERGLAPEPQAAAAAALPRRPGAFFLVVFGLFAVPGTAAQAASPIFGLAWSELSALLLPALVVAAGSNLRVADALLLSRRPGQRALLAAAGVGFAGFLAATAIMMAVSLVLPARWVEAFDLSKLFDRSPLERTALSLVASLLAPFCEEVAFRGWLLTALRTRTTTPRAVAASATLFAFMHLDPVRFVPLLLLGAVFAWLAWRSGSIWPAVVAHATNNVLGTLLAAAAAWSGAAAGRPHAAGLGETVGAASMALAIALPILFMAAAAFRVATPAPPPVGAALVLRDAAEASTRFSFRRVPGPLHGAIVAAAVSLAALAVTGALRHRGAAPRTEPAQETRL